MTPLTRVPAEIKQRARQLRHLATPAESELWSILRRRGVQGAKFRRQHPMAGFILDFYCVEARLGIELDEGQHLNKEAIRQDGERTRILAEQHGLRILRFSNEDVLQSPDRVLMVIRDALRERLGTGGGVATGA